MTEVWESREAYRGSLDDERVRALIQQAMPIIAELPERSAELRPVGGKRLRP